MHQLLYVSSSAPRGQHADIDTILRVSQANNARNSISGLLYTDGIRFLQVLEGENPILRTTFNRIVRDPRHHGIVILHDREIAAREFGEWAMAHRRAEDSVDVFDERMSAALRHASNAVRGTFEGLVAARRA